MNQCFRAISAVWHAKAFTPGSLVRLAMLMTLAYLISEVCGLREYAAFLSGTSVNLDLSWQTVALLGGIHILLHFAFVIGVPILLIAAVLLLMTLRS